MQVEVLIDKLNIRLTIWKSRNFMKKNKNIWIISTLKIAWQISIFQNAFKKDMKTIN